MTPEFDKNKEYGLVLEGGGAKGAYQIGVWKALREYNIPIKGIVGTSVGALNGALICMDSFEDAINLWENISYSQVMNIKDDLIESVKRFDINKDNLIEILRDARKIIFDGGLDISPLKILVSDLLDEDKLRNSKKEFGLVTVSISEFKSLEIFSDEIPKGQLIDFLIASAYFPLFKREKLNGKKYIDGGIRNNLPINMLINKGYKDIISVRVFGIGFEKRIKIDDSINVIEISPTEELPRTLEFSKEKSHYNIQLGYFDAIRMIDKLEGKKYYIKMLNGEDYYIYKLLNISEELKLSLCNMFNIEKSYNRALLENIFPNIARRLNLEKEWTYLDLVIALLEFLAERMKLERFNIYTDLEMVNELKEKIIQYENRNKNNINNKRLRFLILQIIKEI